MHYKLHHLTASIYILTAHQATEGDTKRLNVATLLAIRTIYMKWLWKMAKTCMLLPLDELLLIWWGLQWLISD
jgi:hypothetical protein